MTPSGARSVADAVAAAVRPEIRAQSAYATHPAGGLIKLDAMECPYPLPEAVRSEIAAAAARVDVNRYPDGGATRVKIALREAFAIPESLDLVLGNGSDELILMLALALARPGAVVLAPEPTFVMYRMDALFTGMRFVGVPLRADFSLDIEAMLAAIASERPALVFLAYPNNPTGNLFPEAEIEAIVRAAPGLVVADEAYFAFAGASMIGQIAAHPNLLVLRTLSKIGMAGLRLGYAVAAPEWIAELEKLRPPYNVNALTQAVVPALLARRELLDGWAAEVIDGRGRLEAALRALPGVEVSPSRANFVLARVPDAPRWFDCLLAAGILVKNLHGAHPLTANCLRITVGKPEENAALASALSNLT